MKRYVRPSPISAEDCLRKEVSKANIPQADKLIDHFAVLNQNKHLSNMGLEEEDISQNTIQHPNHANTDQQWEIRQSDNSRKRSMNSKDKHIIRKPERDSVITRTRWH